MLEAELKNKSSYAYHSVEHTKKIAVSEAEGEN